MRPVHRDNFLGMERNDVSRNGGRARNQSRSLTERKRHAVTRGYDVPPERGRFFAGHRCTTRNVGDGDGSAVHRESRIGIPEVGE